jgi:hypothetical protein
MQKIFFIPYLVEENKLYKIDLTNSTAPTFFLLLAFFLAKDSILFFSYSPT